MFKSEPKTKGKSKAQKPAKTTVKPVENSEEKKPNWLKRVWSFIFSKSTFLGILGLALFLVFVSVAYSVAVIWMGTKGLTPKIMTAPIIAFDFVLACIAFSKIFK